MRTRDTAHSIRGLPGRLKFELRRSADSLVRAVRGHRFARTGCPRSGRWQSQERPFREPARTLHFENGRGSEKLWAMTGSANRNKPKFLGIEGGGTRTVALIADGTGAELRRAESGPANLR